MNKMWVAGGKSPNPEGARRHSVRTPKGMISAFIKRKISPKKLAALYDKLNVKEQADFILSLLPYTMAKVTADTLSQVEISELYSKLEQILKDAASRKAI